MLKEIKLTKDFERALIALQEKYGDDFEHLQSLDDAHLSGTSFIDKFKESKTVADVSADSSSNVSHKDIPTLRSEMNKPSEKLLAYNKIFLEIKKRFGLKRAKEWLEAQWCYDLYLHDANTATFMPYCFAYDLKRVAEDGLFYLDTWVNKERDSAKHLDTFVTFLKEFISFVANRTSGACGLPNLIPYMYYFWKKDCEGGVHGLKVIDPEKYAKSQIQNFIYAINQPYTRDGIQTAFTNTSIFDPSYFDALFGGMQFPDGTFAMEEKEGILQFEKWFMEEIKYIKDVEGKAFTFPVNTFSLLVNKETGKFVNEDWARWACEHNRTWNDSNFFIDTDVTSLSNCPLGGDTKILYWSECYNKFVLSPIIDVYNRYTRKNKNAKIKVLANGKVVECKINHFDDKADYLITLSNGAELRTTACHLNKVLYKDYIKTSELTTEDYLPYYNKEYMANDYLTFEEGKLVGMFLGDGSYNNSGVVFSLNQITDREDFEFIEEYCTKRFGAKIRYDVCTSQLTGDKLCTNVCVISPYLKGLIKQFVHGDSALTKDIDLSVLNFSTEFRKGIVEGLYTTDGNKSSSDTNRLYTSSKNLKDSLVVLFSSLGIVTEIYEDNIDGRLGGNTCYTIGWYTPMNKTKRKDSYIIDGDYMWVKIKTIEKIEYACGGSYCLEVVTDGAPEEFMLGNGIVTHNCRLKSNIKDLGYFNSIGGTALKVGSVKVSTINLARIAYKSDGSEDKFMKLLEKLFFLNTDMLDVQRYIIKRNVEKGLLNNFQDGIMDFEHLYSTVGINGMYEVMKTFGYTYKDEFGKTYYKDEALKFGEKILTTIGSWCKKAAEGKDYMINVEQVPAESAAVKFQKADELLYPEYVVKDLPLYGNQWIPLGIEATIQERTRICSAFDSYCDGG